MYILREPIWLQQGNGPWRPEVGWKSTTVVRVDGGVGKGADEVVR